MRRRNFLGIGAAAVAGGVVSAAGLRGEAAGKGSASVRILFLTDLHAREDRDAPARMEATARAISDCDVDLVIAGGDLVHGGFASRPEVMAPKFALAREFIESLGHPVVVLPGNHDFVGARPEDEGEAESDPLQMFREAFGVSVPYARWDHGGVRFFRVQSVEPVEDPWRYEGRISDEQLRWIDAELASTPAEQPIVLCSHIPLQTTFKQVQDAPTAALPPNLVVGNAQELLARFAGHRLVLVLQGHLHVNEMIRWNDRTFVMGGAVSGAWWQGSNLGTPAGYGVLALEGGSVRWDYGGRTAEA